MHGRSRNTVDIGHIYAQSNSSTSHTARVVREIGRNIVAGRYREKSTLPGDAELEAQFGVSRTVLREAVKTLSGKGLVHSKARVGTRVRDRADWNLFDPDVLVWHAECGFDASFLLSLGEMRLALEPEAAALAARRHTADQLQILHDQLGRMETARASGEFVDADLAFHLAVAAMADNPFMRSISTLIEVALVAALTRSSPMQEPEGVSPSVAAHRRIAEAIAASDAESARAAMRAVIEEGMRRAGPPVEGAVAEPG